MNAVCARDNGFTGGLRHGDKLIDQISGRKRAGRTGSDDN